MSQELIDEADRRAGGNLQRENGSPEHTPYRWYSDPDVYALEQTQIYQGKTWNFLALTAEIPNPGDFKSTFVGDTPVVVTRTKNGDIAAWVNRCAHRGAMVCRELRGNATKHTCVYHQWSYDAEGNLRGVPFQRGIKGKAGMPKTFDTKENGLQKLRVDTYHGLVFGTMDDTTPTLVDYLGPQMTPWLDRIFAGRELVYLGCARQFSRSNWKLYLENTKDPYHASLLHLFHTTFNILRATMDSRQIHDDRHGLHSIFTSTRRTDGADASAYTADNLRTYNAAMTLQDPEILRMREEFDEPITNHIQAIFPSLVVQQIHNTLACRQLLPKGPDNFELIFHYFGYADDDDELREMRLLQANLVGPAGLISMEDTEVTELVQQGVRATPERHSTSLMGIDSPPEESAASSVSEIMVRTFWKGYRDLMWPTK
ncbi:Rieske (2Fe-2S) protein [Mycolicibacterium novocastrense]|nr:Rieske 2Fe-2S domain-containing protein [Mycolicibacterium novocastrense]KUH68094.1 Rieske (2Fe-2S) protein [Mycolicibacterium novocastrense]KUH68703.1 Rieske (2Fe-2S) protein [Mycolicibacterium novocastrense]KUH74456.1 Rieske (2Fe-2S) protein [Mycolicibacterium novocastrense]